MEGRPETASAFGATDLVDPTTTNLGEIVRDLTRGQGVDYAFEAAGPAALVEHDVEATRVGAPR